MNAAQPFSFNTNPPFLVGAYVAIDAVPGVFFVVDGPYCVSTKAGIHLAHNVKSTLVPPFGRSRVVPTLLDVRSEEVTRLATDRRGRIEAVLRDVGTWPEAEVLLATSFDFVHLLGLPLAHLLTQAAAEAGKPCAIVSLRADGSWLEGYAAVCSALAGVVPLRGERRPGTVAIVGHLMDRTEADQQANVAELRRLALGAGFETGAVWLSGDGPQALARTGEASVVVSLPYARDAATILARRTGAHCVELDLPVGLQATEAFVRALAAAPGGNPAAAEAFLETELRSAVHDVQPVVDRFLTGLTVAAALSDAHLRRGIASLCAEIGAAYTDIEAMAAPRADGNTVVLAPDLPRGWPPTALVPLGFPCWVDHAVTPRPFLGFAGFRVLVERMAGASLRTRMVALGPDAPSDL